MKRNDNILKGVGYEIGRYRKEEAIQKAITEEWPLAMDDSRPFRQSEQRMDEGCAEVKPSQGCRKVVMCSVNQGFLPTSHFSILYCGCHHIL